jgi:hypothetical protein
MIVAHAAPHVATVTTSHGERRVIGTLLPGQGRPGPGTPRGRRPWGKAR